MLSHDFFSLSAWGTQLDKIMKKETNIIRKNWAFFNSVKNFENLKSNEFIYSKTLELLKPIIDLSIKKLSNSNYNIDPVGDKFSFITSIMSSAYKRHGTILEQALKERLKENNNFEVYNKQKFLITNKAKTLAALKEKAIHEMKFINLKYDNEAKADFLEVDLIVYDKLTNIVSSYEIKRGNGYLDAGKKRSVRQELMSVNFLLKDWMKINRDITVKTAHSFVISYYGYRALPKPFSLIKEELNNHFSYPVINEVEKVNSYFKDKLHNMISQKIYG